MFDKNYFGMDYEMDIRNTIEEEEKKKKKEKDDENDDKEKNE